jgi:hypothetical protein
MTQTSPSELKSGDAVVTPLGRGVVRNFALHQGRVTTVLVAMDDQDDTDRDWRAFSPDVVTKEETCRT